MAQMILLLCIFIGGGLLAPMYTAPAIFAALPVQPLAGQAESQISVRVNNRNLDSMDSVQFTASNPSDKAHLTAIQYSCDIQDVSLLYPTDDNAYKKLPCGTEVYVPAQSRLTIQAQTSRSDVAYVPVTVRVDSGGRTDKMSVIIAVSQINTDKKSKITDTSQVTLEEFGAVR